MGLGVRFPVIGCPETAPIQLRIRAAPTSPYSALAGIGGLGGAALGSGGPPSDGE